MKILLVQKHTLYCFIYIYMWNVTRTCSCEIHPCSAYFKQFGQLNPSDELLDFFTQRIQNSLFLCFISGSDALTFIFAEAENISLFISTFLQFCVGQKNKTNVCSLAWVWMRVHWQRCFSQLYHVALTVSFKCVCL